MKGGVNIHSGGLNGWRKAKKKITNRRFCLLRTCKQKDDEEESDRAASKPKSMYKGLSDRYNYEGRHNPVVYLSYRWIPREDDHHGDPPFICSIIFTRRC